MISSTRTSGIRRVVVVLLAALAVAAAAEAGTVRGRLDRQTPHGTYPAEGVPVTLNHPSMGRSAPSYSGRDGMYYLYNIPPGQYWLEVWVYPNSDPWVFNIVVYDQPYTDISPIVIP